MPDSNGKVSLNPRSNAYTNGATVTLTATPDDGQTFTGWGGDATGLTNPLVVTMDHSKVIVANFTRPQPRLSATTCLEGPSEEGFRLTLTGEFMTPYQIETSST